MFYPVDKLAMYVLYAPVLSYRYCKKIRETWYACHKAVPLPPGCRIVEMRRPSNRHHSTQQLTPPRPCSGKALHISKEETVDHVGPLSIPGQLEFAHNGLRLIERGTINFDSCGNYLLRVPFYGCRVVKNHQR